MVEEETSNPELWNRVWGKASRAELDRDFSNWVTRESNSVRSEKILQYLRSQFGTLEKLRTIEVGSGPGVYSFVLARLGAEVTLLDYSHEAIDLARERFCADGLQGTFLTQNALNPDPDLSEGFDVAMSFGTVEHFRYPERLAMIEAHLRMVRPGGAVVISAPNRAFFPHEWLKKYLQLRRKWELGYEGAFTRAEYERLSRSLGLESSRIVGSAFLSDFGRYVEIYRSTSLMRGLFGQPRLRAVGPERAHWLDDYWGADLIMLGVKASGRTP